MTFKRSFTTDAASHERRSGLNRRWIKAPYDGIERRRMKDRRGELAETDGVPDPPPSALGNEGSLENLLLSTTVRLEALVRLLVEKNLLSQQEIADMLRTMQAEYRTQQLKDE